MKFFHAFHGEYFSYVYSLQFQDGFLERLSSSEFVALCKEVEKFVCLHVNSHISRMAF